MKGSKKKTSKIKKKLSQKDQSIEEEVAAELAVSAQEGKETEIVLMNEEEVDDEVYLPSRQQLRNQSAKKSKQTLSCNDSSEKKEMPEQAQKKEVSSFLGKKRSKPETDDIGSIEEQSLRKTRS